MMLFKNWSIFWGDEPWQEFGTPKAVTAVNHPKCLLELAEDNAKYLRRFGWRKPFGDEACQIHPQQQHVDAASRCGRLS